MSTEYLTAISTDTDTGLVRGCPASIFPSTTLVNGIPAKMIQQSKIWRFVKEVSSRSSRNEWELI
jgi:hypothetical protein